MADNHDYGTEHEHRGSLAFEIEEGSEERSETHRENREYAEKLCRRGGIHSERLLDEVRRISLERENCAVVEHAKKGYNPEHLAGEDLAEVAYVELVFSRMLLCCLTCLDKLLVELAVHNREHEVVNQAHKKKCRAETKRSKNCRILEFCRDNRGNPHHCEHAKTSNRHLKAHSEGHLLAFEPLGEHL